MLNPNSSNCTQNIYFQFQTNDALRNCFKLERITLSRDAMTGTAAAMLGMEVRTRYQQLWSTAAERAPVRAGCGTAFAHFIFT